MNEYHLTLVGNRSSEPVVLRASNRFLPIQLATVNEITVLGVFIRFWGYVWKSMYFSDPQRNPSNKMLITTAIEFQFIKYLLIHIVLITLMEIV